jgi:putative DNA primase/helicase
VKDRPDANGNTVFVLEVCPFDPAHGRDAAILQGRDGQLGFKCFHDGCRSNCWSDVKGLIGKPDPNHWDPPLTKGRKKRSKTKAKTSAEVAGDDDEFDAELSLLLPEGRTDKANGKRFARMHADSIGYCFAWKCWVVWDGRRWRRDDSGAAMRMAGEVADSIWKEAREESRNDEKALAWAAASAGHPRMEAMLKQARSHLSLSPELFDREPMLLNCPNGTVDLRTGELRPHRREDYLTALCPTPFKPDAKAPTWEKFLDAVFHGDGGLVAFHQRFRGYCLTGITIEQVLAIFCGEGANGKSTELETLFDVVGPDYAAPGSRELLMVTKQGSHPTEVADLFGKRLVTCTETRARFLNEELVKQLTGSDSIKCRRMYENFWSFKPTHKLVIVTSHKPKVRHLDHAMRRRLRIVPFDICFLNPDRSMPAKLKAEAEGIRHAERGSRREQNGRVGTEERCA